jgi:hypothetical protein
MEFATMQTVKQPKKPKQQKSPAGSGQVGNIALRRFFKHHITGEIYDAWEYGHKSWPIGKRS